MDTITLSSETLVCGDCGTAAVAMIGDDYLCADHTLIALADQLDLT